MTQVAFADFAVQSFEDTTLNERELAISYLTTTLALEDQQGVKGAIVAAKQAGLDNDEIQQVINVVITVKGQRIQALTGIQAPVQAAQTSCCR